MPTPFRLKALAALALLPAAVLPATAQTAAPQDKAVIEQIVRDYLLAHPEVIQEALGELERRQQAAETEKRAEIVASVRDELFQSKRQVVLGNPDAPITLVEFFDYNCGYCKRSLADKQAILDEDKDVRIVLKEFPILGNGSVEAARVAVAVNLIAPEKYGAFHDALLGGRGEANTARALDVAEEVGLDRAASRRGPGILRWRPPSRSPTGSPPSSACPGRRPT
ncbi:Disulfide bond formation protein D precursor [Methylobrevis pamukkalensis]|uniref:Disulfide bond formation protein D n=1 Tax=Methylobrevis pamukkalensis TaxID=1439726 RepID=A0A1E3H061_9HYPH|nr:thioredoxin domain-containing protein [Methylobrevis pamukkalensis]ODN69728.1 Disulfide bond formation protein D precursor [Methylobrevis pamukkalensis]